MAPTFIGGKLSLKGDKKQKKTKKKSRSSKNRRSVKTEEEKDTHRREENKVNHDGTNNSDDDMTDAERRAMKFKLERERKDLEDIAQKSHRECVESFSEKLGNLTELNDIPRVSSIKMLSIGCNQLFRDVWDHCPSCGHS